MLKVNKPVKYNIIENDLFLYSVEQMLKKHFS